MWAAQQGLLRDSTLTRRLPWFRGEGIQGLLPPPPPAAYPSHELPPALRSQIQEDFEHWQNITLKHVEQAYCGSDGQGFRLQVLVAAGSLGAACGATDAATRRAVGAAAQPPCWDPVPPQIIDGRMYIAGESASHESRNWFTGQMIFRASAGHTPLPDVDMMVRRAAELGPCWWCDRTWQR